MNERIKALAEQAEEIVFASPSTGRTSKQLNIEKFAELIVRECASQCTTEGPFGAEVVWGTQFNKKILTHFGVEK